MGFRTATAVIVVPSADELRQRERDRVCGASSVGTHRLLVDAVPDRVNTRGLMSLGAFQETHNFFTTHIKLHTL